MKIFNKYFAFLLLITACEPEAGEEIPTGGMDYFPLSVGYFQIYNVNEITYQQGTEPDTAWYELKVQVVDSFANTTGGTTYVLYRSVRDDENDEWSFRETWSARLEEGRNVVVSEGNISYVVLRLPANPGLTWDGNTLNSLEEDKYEVLAVNEPFSIDTVSFDKTITVQQEFNDDPIVFTDIRKEVYAEGIGLVYKELKQLVICQQQTCNSNEIIEKGVDLKQYIKAYGKTSN